MKFLHLKNFPIYEQLQIEEALLRCNQDNFCIINEGTSRAIVMGISGKAEDLIDLELASKDNIPIIKRFSGGGTVIVDENTLFITFVCQKELHPHLIYPSHILRWSEEFYRSSFSQDQFHLKENDFVIGNKKCGGNAHYLKKDRWLQHTSFLFDFEQKNMNYLLFPKKVPTYRQNRSHSEFLCKLRDFFPSKEEIVSKVKNELKQRYLLEEVSLHHLSDLMTLPHRKSVLHLESQSLALDQALAKK